MFVCFDRRFGNCMYVFCKVVNYKLFELEYFIIEWLLLWFEFVKYDYNSFSIEN